MTDQDRQIKTDRMRYIKNKFSSNLALVAIIFDVFFFVSIYKSDVSTYYYTLLIGVSIVYNLAFMLAAFLSSEGVKSYGEGYCYLLIVLGIIQFVRIFIIPWRASHAVVTIANEAVVVMGSAQFLRCTLFLVISGICCIVAAVVGIQRSRTLKAYVATLGEEHRRD
ncbi:MAG: hypothetical protein SOZ46_04975 [Bullifex sp.]|nr:hypothetical protein [Spirochaetales bacterium]MDY2816191.1 hypothetical protein [Bullifex sp.]MDY3850153.1 hypothetical protein [Bullifex sp.]